ncbi:hypothetical protein JCM17380_12980 [Desulfosporosinus burensis]
MRSIISLTREVYHCYMRDDGSLYERPIGSIARRNLSKNQDDFLKRYIDLIMNTKIVSDTTKIYITSTLPSVASVIKQHNVALVEHKQVNIKTAQSKIDYDGKKLLNYFTGDMLSQVIGFSNCDLCEYNKMLNLAISDYKKRNKLLDNIMLTLPRVPVVDSLSDEELHDFIQIISPFIKKHRHYVESNIPKNAVGYLLYLTSTPSLSGRHKEHYDLLKQILE